MAGTTLTNNVGAGERTLPNVIAGDGALTKTGAGRLLLGAANTYTGATTVSGGTLRVNGSLTSSAITVEDTGRLEGTGTVGAVTVANGGTVAPGTSAGTFSVGSITFQAASTFAVELDTPNIVGGGVNDLLVTSGVVSLTGATLMVSLAQTPSFGGVYRLINNNGPGAPGTFDGLPEGATVIAAGRQLQISYVGGDGNDVTLTVMNVAPTITDIANQTIDEDAVDGVAGVHDRRLRNPGQPHGVGQLERPDARARRQHRPWRRRREPHGHRDTGAESERRPGHDHAHGE